MRTVEGYLPKPNQAYVLGQTRQAYKAQTASTARKLLVQLATWRERGGHENASSSLREGLEETLTVLVLQVARRGIRRSSVVQHVSCRTRRGAIREET